ncbi:MAG: dihydrolipoyllysine-residue succinyltransferase, partial [Alphaproteobacteria bacterium]|nr:dihydrolipoyllysine-residue succinyltransferase [Alphaproteobacteria bacterium]
MEIKVPALGESITEATVARWMKAEGDTVEEDEAVLELETDKVSVEVMAPQSGTLTNILVQEGETVEIGSILGNVDRGKKSSSKQKKASQSKKSSSKTNDNKSKKSASVEPPKGAEKGASTPRKLDKDREERVPMTTLRKRIAERMKASQNTAAMLTSFSEVDMSAVMRLRKKYKEIFEEKYGIKLGLMSFFTKATVRALKEFPVINAEVENEDIIYKNYYNIGIAVSLDKGLVVPVVRDADTLSLADVEKEIAALAGKARENKLTIEDLSKGTFTITNGGVFGSLLSTPILNPPQSAILGLHKIEERPVAIDGQVQIRPMMYLALTYDHRIIDGKEAVSFLVHLKDSI